MQARAQAQEAVTVTFKRHILEKTSSFAAAPQEDLWRVHALGRMLARYDELIAGGFSEWNASQHVLREFADLAGQMYEMGFEPHEQEERSSRWTRLNEKDAEEYLRQQDAYQHRIALGAALCTASVVPVLVTSALAELFGFAGDALDLLGVGGLFGVIALGVYLIVTAAKPKEEKRIRKGQFAIGTRLRRRLEQMQEMHRARKRKGKGIVMMITSLLPVLAGVGLDEFFWRFAGEPFSIIGVAGMLMMIAAGVYEFVMADGEKKTLRRLLNPKE